MEHIKVIASIQDSLASYAKDNALKCLVLGVSGGVDSALCAAIARPVCDSLNIGLTGRSIPIATNKRDEIARAVTVGKEFCTDFKEVDLGDAFPRLIKTLIEDDEPGDITHERKVRRGNLKARLRMVRLYDLAAKHRGMVISTDNLTECMLGFWTLNGDVGDYALIQRLWKTEVYELSDFMAESLESQHRASAARALRECIEAVPTDGLGVSNSDLEQFGAQSYDEVDRILKIWLCKDQDNFSWDTYLNYHGRPVDYEEFVKLRESYSEHPVVKRYLASEFKRCLPLFQERWKIEGLDKYPGEYP